MHAALAALRRRVWHALIFTAQALIFGATVSAICMAIFVFGAR